MNVTDMRAALKQRYGDTIRNRHVDYMPDGQVMAIYHSLIDRKDPFIGKERNTVPKKRRLHEPIVYEQTRMEI